MTEAAAQSQYCVAAVVFVRLDFWKIELLFRGDFWIKSFFSLCVPRWRTSGSLSTLIHLMSSQCAE